MYVTVGIGVKILDAVTNLCGQTCAEDTARGYVTMSLAARPQVLHFVRFTFAE